MGLMIKAENDNNNNNNNNANICIAQLKQNSSGALTGKMGNLKW